MKGIVSMMIMCCSMIILMTPTKMAFMLTTFSIIMGMFMYSTSASVFCASAVIISFSSGMMVVLCYCSMSSNFETKSMSKMTEAGILSMMTLMLTMSKMKYSMNQEMLMKMFMNSMMISLMMLFILMAMKAVNISTLNPTKSMMLTY